MSSTKRPNIVFIFADQQHYQAVGFQDHTFTTPNLDRFAKESTVFTHAFCSTPQCSPSRSSILTGLYPSKTGVMGNVTQAGGEFLKIPTIGAALQKAGYRTAWFGKWHLGDDPQGVAGWDEDFGVTGRATYDDPEVTRRAVDFLERQKDSSQPFALFVSINDPHDIYHFHRLPDPAPETDMELPRNWHEHEFDACPAIHRQFMEEDQGKVIENPDQEKEWKHYRKVYREKTRLFDQWAGRVLDALRESGRETDTLTVVTSDHGDMDGQHRLIYKGPFLFEAMVHVPLLIRLPGQTAETAGRRTTNFMTVNVDLAPTLADFAGIDLGEVDGLSLRPLLTGEGEVPDREFVVGQYYSKQKWINPIRMIRTRHYKYNRYLPHGEELYDLEADPDEVRNLADHPDYAAVKADLGAKLDQWIKENDDPFYSQQATGRDGCPLPVG